MNPHLLIVDDNRADRELLMEHLHESGYEIEVATDGLDAWNLVDGHADLYDAILLDRQMPHMTGLQFLERIKNDPELQIVPVILQTAAADRHEVLEGIQAGAYCYLTKPYDGDMLRSVVRTAVNDHARYKALQRTLKKGLNSLALLQDALFAYTTIEEATSLGGILANACPDPARVVVGLTELLINSVEHGNLGISYDEKSELNASGKWFEELAIRLALPENLGKKAEVRFQRLGNELRFTIRDTGPGFDWKRFLQADPKRAFDTHGRGIAMANLFTFSRLQYNGSGNEVVGTINLE
ncbi:MAG TPA: response regulator [Thermoanaerobaculia bacterium]|nr:response regulator [Thermoanaerobaculia bacterium]